jgi:cytochrome oxidase Cu insertion factor (SCO1/SenC/PrrC family)
MMRWIATIAILGLMVLTVLLPHTSIGRRGNEATLRAHVGDRAGRVGEPMPDFALADLDGEIVRLSDLRGHRVLLTFERSLDW